MLKVMAEGEGRQHVQGDVRGVSHVQGDGRGGGVGRQPCSSRWEGVRSISHVQCDGRGRGASVMFKVV